ncbi:MAG: prephenate dehydratase [Candidatus Micrarchaeota archaeon]|nr:prephenate dehydratase [Candidatus Micrarchaeota archaeon]
MRVGVLGPEASFSEIAARKLFPRAEMIYFETISECIEAVPERVEYAVVPIENSLHGTVFETLDAITESGLKICAEKVIPVIHCLVGFGKLEGIEKIISHPQALAQCRKWIRKNLPGAKLEKVSSTSLAAKLVAELSSPSVAAISSREAARVFGLKVIVENIQDSENNATRFVCVSTKDSPRTGRDKTSIVFACRENRPGVLWEALGEFAKRGVNLTKIESRPSKKMLGEYIFYLDFEGHREDEKIKECISSLEKITAFLRILGSYPRDF